MKLGIDTGLQAAPRAIHHPKPVLSAAAVSVIPGLLSMVIGLPGLSVALALSREREHGTLEQLMTTPLKRVDLLMGKITPYIFGGLINVLLTTAIARFWFNVPFNGKAALA